MANTVQKSPIEILKQRDTIEIPDYQRPYSWRAESEIDDLINDIRNAFERMCSTQQSGKSNEFDEISDLFNDPVPKNEKVTDINSIKQAPANYNHFFGTIVAIESENGLEIADGQQRLTTISLLCCAIIRTLRESLHNENNYLDKKDGSNELKEEYEGFYLDELKPLIRKPSGNNKLVLKDNLDGSKKTDQEVYEDIVIHSLEKDSGQETEFQSHFESYSQKKLINAYNTFIRTFRTMPIENVVFILEEILSEGMENIVYKVDEENSVSASLMFELVNDRGKQINNLDKIRSSIIYASVSEFGNELPEGYRKTVGKKISQVYRHLGELGETEDEINNFVSYHWKSFTGERGFGSYGKENINRRILHELHAGTEDAEQFKNWVDTYLESMVSSAESFSKIRDAKKISNASSKESISCINYMGNSSKYHALLMVAHNRLNSKKFTCIARACELLSFKVHNICNEPSHTARDTIEKSAHAIEWLEGPNDYSLIQKDITKSNSEWGLEEIIKRLLTKSSQRDEKFRKTLKQKDLLNESGGDELSVFTDKCIKYILYKYEKELDQKLGHNNIQEWMRGSHLSINDTIELEHVYPQDADQSVKDSNAEKEEVKNRLGNLVLLESEYNSSNSQFKQKRKFYRKSELKQVEQLLTHNEWERKQIDKATEAMAKEVHKLTSRLQNQAKLNASSGSN